MAKTLNSYIKYLISEHEPLVKLIQERGGLLSDRLTDDEINAALHQPFNCLIREGLLSLRHFVRLHKTFMNADDLLKSLIAYLSDAIPVVEMNKEQLFGAPRVQLQDLHQEYTEAFKSLVMIDMTLKSNRTDLLEQYAKLESYAEALHNGEKTSHQELLLKMLADLEKNGISLSDTEKADFLQDCSWGQLVKMAKEITLALPDAIDYSQPDYSTYFKLKRCIAIGKHHQIVSVNLPSVNDALHPDLLSTIQQVCQQNDSVTQAVFLLFNDYCEKTKKSTQEFNQQLIEKKSLIISLHQQALELATFSIPDAKSLKAIARETVGQEMNQLPLLKAG